MRQKVVGNEFAGRNANGKGNEDAGKRNRNRGLTDLAHQPQIRLHAREKKQKQNPDLRDTIEHRRLRRAFLKKRMLGAGPKGAENGRAEHKTRDQLTDYRRLANALHQFAQQSSTKNQDDDLRE
jgi:hypothetical protein